MKKGFTLIEMVAVIFTLSLISLIVLPAIINQIGNKKGEVSDASLKIIYNAAELYMTENPRDYKLLNGNTYCIIIEKLVNNGKLTVPLLDLKTGDEISLDRGIKVTFNSYDDPEYKLTNNSKCTE